MGEVSYLPLIEDMVWSYSRIESFNDCPYRFFLKYISKCKETDKFYASYSTTVSYTHILDDLRQREVAKVGNFLE